MSSLYHLLFFRKKLFPIIFFLCPWLTAFAQEYDEQIEKKWTLNFGLVLNKASVIDYSFSSIPYEGYNAGALAAIEFQKRRSTHKLGVYYTQGTLRTSNGQEKNLSNSYFNLDYLNIYEIGFPKAFICKAGGGLNVLYASRNYNDFINHNSSNEFAASLSAVIQFSYSFKNTLEGFSIADQINIPLISSIVQPAFGSDYNQGVAEDNASSSSAFLKSNRFVSVSSLFRLKNCIAIEKNISRGQKISIGYTWDYYLFSTSREVKQANHRLGLAYSFTF